MYMCTMYIDREISGECDHSFMLVWQASICICTEIHILICDLLETRILISVSKIEWKHICAKQNFCWGESLKY